MRLSEVMVFPMLLMTTMACSGPSTAESVGHTFEQCSAPVSCDQALPELGAPGGFRHTRSTLMSKLTAEHRGHDVYWSVDSPQILTAKFAYGESKSGIIDKDLEDEDIDVYALRGCGDTWELLGSGSTFTDDEGTTERGGYTFDDWGGRLLFDIPPERSLGLGRHRIHLVVRGDGTAADLFVEVAPRDTRVFVSDVDGTLTTGELEDVLKRPFGSQPNIRPHAVEALKELAMKGFRPLYLTARPARVTGRTRELLDEAGFPPGVVRTSQSGLGVFGDGAVDFKRGEIEALFEHGMEPTIAIGNTHTDAAAFAAAGVAERFFFQYDDDTFGGVRFDDYAELAALLANHPVRCAQAQQR